MLPLAWNIVEAVWSIKLLLKLLDMAINKAHEFRFRHAANLGCLHWPSLNKMSVGMPRTPNLGGVAGFLSTSNFTILIYQHIYATSLKWVRWLCRAAPLCPKIH